IVQPVLCATLVAPIEVPDMSMVPQGKSIAPEHRSFAGGSGAGFAQISKVPSPVPFQSQTRINMGSPGVNPVTVSVGSRFPAESSSQSNSDNEPHVPRYMANTGSFIPPFLKTETSSVPLALAVVSNHTSLPEYPIVGAHPVGAGTPEPVVPTLVPAIVVQVGLLVKDIASQGIFPATVVVKLFEGLHAL